MEIAKQHWYPIDIIHSLKPFSLLGLAGVSVLDMCPSTNDYLLSREPPIRTKFNLCVARTQSAGRGRYGKIWYSDHDGIYLSVSWQAIPNTTNKGWLLLIAAVRLAESLQVLGISDIGIKWPNDLYYKNAKLAGILIEQRGNTMVMGIGLNIETPSATINGTGINWAGLDRTGIVVPTYTELLALVLDAALGVRDPIDFNEGKKRFSKFDVLYNRSIEINKKGKGISAVARGIDRKARLLVDNKGQLSAYDYAEISINNDGIINRCRQQPL